MDQEEADKQAGRIMIEEFLEQEMGIRSDHLQEVMGQVIDFFPKTKTGWRTLVVSFQTEAIAEWILKGKYKMRMGIVGEDKPVVENWVPSGMYKRYNAVKSIAWKQRHENGMKTQIRFGESDFFLVTRRSKSDYWSQPIPLSGLPDFQLSASSSLPAREARSPTQAPGRERYGGRAGRREKRALSASPGHSPINKQSKKGGLSADSSQEMSSSSEEGGLSFDSNVSTRRRASGA